MRDYVKCRHRGKIINHHPDFDLDTVPLTVLILSGCWIGKGVVFGENVKLSSKVCIMDDAVIGSETWTKHHAIVGSGVHIPPGSVIETYSRIGPDAWELAKNNYCKLC